MQEILKKIRNKPRDNEELFYAIENYMKSTISFIDTSIDTYIYNDFIDDIYNSVYSALVMRKTTSLGVSRAIKTILKELDIESEISMFFSGSKGSRIVNYVVIVNDKNIIDPFNAIICDRNFIKKDSFYKDVQIIKLEKNFFDKSFDYFNEYEVEKNIKNNGL